MSRPMHILLFAGALTGVVGGATSVAGTGTRGHGVTAGMIGAGACILIFVVGCAIGQFVAHRTERRTKLLTKPEGGGFNSSLPTKWETGYQPYVLALKVKEQFEQLPARIREPVQALYAVAQRMGSDDGTWDIFVGQRPGEDYFFAFANRSGVVPTYRIYYATPKMMEIMELFAAVVGVSPKDEEQLCWPPDDA